MVAVLSKEVWKKRLGRLKQALRPAPVKVRPVAFADGCRELADYGAYQAFLESGRDEIQARLKLLATLEAAPKPAAASGLLPAVRRLEQAVTGREVIVTPGFCVCCGETREFETPVVAGQAPNWREGLICPDCGMNSRMRACIDLLQDSIRLSPGSRIYLTEQVTTLFRWVAARYPASVGSEFLRDGTAPGRANAQGIRHEDLTGLSFADGVFDAVISLEVCEHIPTFQKAFAECARVLKPGGKFLLSVPFHRGPTHLTRARVTDSGEIEHLEEPEYHGDPIDPQGCLCFHHFGWDILEHLRAAGFSAARAVAIWSPELGYLENCGYQIMFVAEKQGDC